MMLMKDVPTSFRPLPPPAAAANTLADACGCLVFDNNRLFVGPSSPLTRIMESGYAMCLNVHGGGDALK